MSEAQTPLCKVFVKVTMGNQTYTEFMWAHQVSPTTARITNIPFYTDQVGYEDIVRVGINGEVVEVLERATRTRCSSYEPEVGEEAIKLQWKSINDHFEKLNILCESAIAGVFSMAVPLDMSDDALRELVGSCPVKLAPPREPSEDQFKLLLERSGVHPARG
jgi:hypothetical protein